MSIYNGNIGASVACGTQPFDADNGKENDNDNNIAYETPSDYLIDNTNGYSQQNDEIVDVHNNEFVEERVSIVESVLNMLSVHGNYVFTRNPDMDRMVDGVVAYNFLMDFTHFSSNLETSSPYFFAYLWINSETGEIELEEIGYCFESGERNMYITIPDSRFPIPMYNGIIIPYDRFFPANFGSGVFFAFIDITVMEIYSEQLREAGFIDKGPGTTFYRWWFHYEETDENITAGFSVIMHLYKEFTMNMFVNVNRPQW